MVYRNPILKFKDLVSQKDNPAEPLEGVSSYYAGFARYALLKGLELLDINKGDSVLVPAYICEAAIEPFLAREIVVTYYKIRQDFSVDMRSLEEKITPKTKAILYVNYFGLCNESNYFQKFCRDRNLFFIEDNAHILSKDYRQVKGDISIFSLRKFYPVPDGALLIIKNNKIINGNQIIYNDVSKEYAATDYKFIIGSMCRKIYQHCSNYFTNNMLSTIRKKKEKMLSFQDEEIDMQPYKKMSKLSFAIIKNSSFHNIIAKRRENYKFLLERLISINSKYIRIIFNKLNDTTAPLAFPVAVEKHRNSFIDNLFLNGYAVYVWPDMPREIVNDSSYQDEHFLSKAVALLPIHQGITKKELSKMAHIIKGWADKIGQSN